MAGFRPLSPLDQLFAGDDAQAQAALPLLTPADVPPLIQALHTGAPDARWWAACALAQFSLPASTQALLQAAADPNADVRAAVFHALGEQRAAEAVLPLLMALADPSDYLARLAGDALSRIGSPAVPGLIRALTHDAQTQVRIYAARALALIGDPAAIPALFNALNDESILVQHWADEGLERLGVGQVYFQP